MTAKKAATSRSSALRSSAGGFGDVVISLTPSRSGARNQTAESRSLEVSFGSVTVHVRAPSKSAVQRNIKAGQFALERATKGLARSGVKIEISAGIPMFHADPIHPDRLVRELDGVRELGRFVNGTFRAIA